MSAEQSAGLYLLLDMVVDFSPLVLFIGFLLSLFGPIFHARS